MIIRLNGEVQKLASSSSSSAPPTITDLLKTFEIKASSLAIAINQEIIPRSEFDSRCIQENDAIEIIHAVGGG